MKEMFSLGLKHVNNRLEVLDQRRLPHDENWIWCKEPKQMAELIQTLAVRGAPLIGVAAALSLAKYIEEGASAENFLGSALVLRNARPTAVNLMYAIDRLIEVSKKNNFNSIKIIEEAQNIFNEDVSLCELIASNGERLIQNGDNVLTHCNAGGLATAGIGTALGVIRKAHENGKKIHVYVDETRPLLQGARLTTWELRRLGIPHTLLCDNMAGVLMKEKKIQKIFVGADRIAKNGDVANKIGTYSLAVLAFYHQIPFYVAAPSTTVDHKIPNGNYIPIENRQAKEVQMSFAPDNCNIFSHVFNPAFDVTPHYLITNIILDTGVILPAQV
ncbi:MAG: S-methyl-5-thioribose-1-phosphate isomerase [Deltaproteobacteria bacterium]|nr:S-methyl-5-thioribose-1-phosphate isomerase [Deltaproteobacteria bacterium]